MTLKKKPFKNIVGKGENPGNQQFLLVPQSFLSIPKQFSFFVDSPCGKRDIVVTRAPQCMWVCLCVCPLRFVRTITSTFINRFPNNLVQLFFLMSGYAISRFHSDKSKVKVTWALQVVPEKTFGSIAFTLLSSSVFSFVQFKILSIGKELTLYQVFNSLAGPFVA